MISCIIIDDEPLARALLESHVAEVPFLKLVGTFDSALNASQFIAEEPVGLVFLDIEMPRLSGMDFLKSISNPPDVIFTTAYRKYALESYDFDAVDYLLKPITFPRFLKAVNKLLNSKTDSILAKSADNKQDFLFLNVNRKKIKVVFEEIEYIESLKDYIRIHTADEKIMAKEQLTRIMESMPSYFLRVHRSYVVNTQKITAFTAVDIEIGKIEIPIGGKYKEQVFSYLA